MNRTAHHELGALTGGWLALITNEHPRQLVMTITLVTITSGGKLSPDCDQYKFWRWARTIEAGQHRMLTHWWGLPALALLACAMLPALVSDIVSRWAFGWLSHLLGDFVFGDACNKHGAGIPMLPWGCHVGLLGRRNGLKSDGALAKICQWIILPLGLVHLLVTIF